MVSEMHALIGLNDGHLKVKPLKLKTSGKESGLKWRLAIEVAPPPVPE